MGIDARKVMGRVEPASAREQREGAEDLPGHEPDTSLRNHRERNTGELGGSHQRPRESRVQIAVTWVSGLLLLSIVVYLIWEGTQPFTPPAFDATVQQVRFVGGRYHVSLRLSNEGGQSVQSLGVVLELRDGGEVVESAAAVLDWLPERSSRELVLIVDRDPSRFESSVRFEGYQIP